MLSFPQILINLAYLLRIISPYCSEQGQGELKMDITRSSPQTNTCSEGYKSFMQTENITNPPIQPSKLIHAIEEYGDSQIVWLHVLALIGEKHIVKSQLNGRIIDHSRQRLNLSLHSSCGSGKSYNTIELIRLMQEFCDLPFIKPVCGVYTAKALFTLLTTHPDSTFYVDECQHIMKDPTMTALLRQMLFGSGVVSWQTTRESENIELVRFRGNIIMSMNSYVGQSGELFVRDEHLKANLDRCVVLTLKPTKEDAINIKKRQYDIQLDYEAWEQITKKIVECRMNPTTIILSNEETAEILQFWQDTLNNEYNNHQHVSLRSYDKTVQIFARLKLLFDGLDSELMTIAKRLSKRIIKPQIPRTKITQIIKQSGGKIKRAELCKVYSEQEAISLRQAQRKVREALVGGEVRQDGMQRLSSRF